MISKRRRSLSDLLKDKRILISEKAEENIRDMPRAKRRSLLAPLMKIIDARIEALENFLHPCFKFGGLQPEPVVIGGVIRRETIILVGFLENALQIFSAIDRDQLIKRHDTNSKSGCWHVKSKFPIMGRMNGMYVWTIKKLMFFIARFGQWEQQPTRYVYSFEKNRYMTEQEVEIFMRTHDGPTADAKGFL